MVDPETKRAILARVEAALDRLDDAREPPAGLVPELLDDDAAPPDLYSLLAPMTAHGVNNALLSLDVWF